MKQPLDDEAEGLRPEEESDLIEEIKKEEDREEADKGPHRGFEEEEKDGKRIVHLEIKPIDLTLSSSATYDSICHSWFIVKDKGVAINWKKPLIQKCQITSKIEIAKDPFAEGAMRYAFMMEDKDLNKQYVVKVPKDINPKSYHPLEMKNDTEAIFVCSHIVNEFNEKLVTLINSKYLVEFVHSFIYEILDKNAPFKYYYGENFIKGKYEKYNNNAGWAGGQDANQSLIA